MFSNYSCGPGIRDRSCSTRATLCSRRRSRNRGFSQCLFRISGHGDLFLDGEFAGTIRIASGTITVGPNARVRAEIEATEIIIRGDVIGTLKASERVHIWSTGKLTGDMETRGIVIDDGAVLCSTVAAPQASVREGTVPEGSLSGKDHLPQPSSPEPPPRAKGASA